MHILKKITQDDYDKSDSETRDFYKEEAALQEDILNEFAKIASLIIDAHPENHPQQMLASVLSAGVQFVMKSAFYAAVPKEVMQELCDQTIEDAYKDPKQREELAKKVKAHIQESAKKATKN